MRHRQETDGEGAGLDSFGIGGHLMHAIRGATLILKFQPRNRGGKGTGVNLNRNAPP